ncbi:MULTISPECIES: malonate decarboxylase holo-ACP synthase [unclassified Pseudomonas]|uniref:malonate decarboxylase holo-ACP synthase n=1 Tax=unclassified Pseudomonas TaxID=196821 RepID=UPI000D345D01|nr:MULTISPECIES: malonate decarboxylase holo-ACP synthase [unclassified Pseudomonas]RAU46150.1 malonate decarboxylase holo-ACP synthase [Pseudomonas sp. RIT 409]RAU53805.1 malonate decarboxylase holo-ACP synthase [Pseudomonas sp. RIT 412]
MTLGLPVQPHDLLWGLPVATLPADAPGWVFESVALGHPVVVRRARVDRGSVAVGVRGQSRDQRYATVMNRDHVTRQVRPEQLVEAVEEVRTDWPVWRALNQVRPVLDAIGLPWGITGGAGFELATGIQVLHRNSDLDLILRTESFLSRPQAAQWLEALNGAACRIDLQLQTPAGAVALREWAGSGRQVLLKADNGARLVSDPWLCEEYA